MSSAVTKNKFSTNLREREREREFVGTTEKYIRSKIIPVNSLTSTKLYIYDGCSTNLDYLS